MTDVVQMFCPECGGFIVEGAFLSVCDKNEEDEQSYTRCPHCTECIHEEEWEYENE